ncbi:MAG TPA: hypothetical protein VNB22_17280 [Pyrinomonadaceae bacterium]|jgi:hypothetical protein|nr:hypothetical protein [Pyrinomonadaceae bacterium]
MKCSSKPLSASATEKSKKLKATLLEEFPAVSEKFYTFTHEGISMIWLNETSDNPIRGIRSRKK